MNIELLEARQLLAADPIINEFLARNDGGLRDGDGRTSDWIELFNAGDQPVDLAGYHLTDDPSEPSLWTFPSKNLNPSEYLVVFASGQETDDYVDADGNLHTNFTLQRGGEYVGLYDPDGNVVSQFSTDGTDFPEQLTNISYGGAQALTLIDGDDQSDYRVPGFLDPNSLDWTQPDFDAAANGFSRGTTRIGYEERPTNRTNFVDEFDTELADRPHAVYARMEFELSDASAISDLLLNLKYDNGYIAYVNGVKVSEDNAPANPSPFSTAPNRDRRDREALEFVAIDISEHRETLISGTNVLAIHVLNNISDQSDLLLAAELHAGASDLERAIGAPARVGYLSDSTPGGPNVGNDGVFIGFVDDTSFSVDRGFYNEPFEVEISSATEDAVIRYTTDGSTPTADHGTIYAGPITVSTTTPMRARAFKDGFMPSNVDTQTYLFVDHVANQGNTPAGYPTEWGLGDGPQRPADYEVDPEITGNPAYEDIFDDALLQVPTVSIVTDVDYLFDPDIGIYQNTMKSGADWEVPTSVELIHPDGTVGFQENAALRIQGGASREPPKSPKHSFRLLFKGDFGATKLNYRWFGEETAVDEFDTIILRAGFNQSYIHHNTFLGDNRGRAQYVRDQWAKDMQRAMGYPAPHNTYAHLYINGMYWGLYNPTERPTDDFAASYFGGEKDEYDVYNSGELLDGTSEAWDRLWTELEDDMSDDAQYQEVAEILDIPAYIDYMIINHYGANADWDDHNWYATRRRTDDGKWQFYMWDSEFLFIGKNDNAIRTSDGRRFPAWALRSLVDNAEFRMLYADHIQRHFFNDGLLTPDNVIDLWEAKASQITDAIIGESARWGDYRRDVDPSGSPLVLLERDIHYAAERDRLLNDYFPDRTDIVIRQYQRDRWDLFPSVDAPTLNQHGGEIPPGFEAQLTADGGVIYYTLDGSDPRVKGGGVSADALVYDGAFPLNSNAVVKARALENGQWSALTEAEFVVPSGLTLRITELNYNPYEVGAVTGVDEDDRNNDDFEFVELMNVGDQPIDLTGASFVSTDVDGDSQGIDFDFSAQILAAGERIVVVKDPDAFQSRYGTNVSVALGGHGENVGAYSGRISNEGEQITLLDADGRVVQQFTYGVEADWPTRAARLGSSMEVISTDGNYNDASNWKSSADIGGSPGTAGSVLNASGIRITEVLANSATAGGDLVELHNETGESIDIRNWSISDSPDDFIKTRIPNSTVIPPNGYLVLTEQQLGFSLDGDGGGQLILVAADASGMPVRFADDILYAPTPVGVSQGPWPTADDSFVALGTPTFGGPNTGPGGGVSIPGDSNGDGQFNQLDIVQVLQANKYLTGEPADRSEGDWNGDGVFDQLDIVAALQGGQYLAGVEAIAVNIAKHGDASDGPTVKDSALAKLGYFQGG